VTSPGLGLRPQDAQMLCAHAQIVVHSAATVQFNEPLDVAVEVSAYLLCLGVMNLHH
jgi:thioester reductase-like protein